MILPTKHTTLEQSFIGFGGYLLQIIGKGATVDELWKHYQRDFTNGIYNAKQSFDNLLLTLVFLFSINAVFEDNGALRKCV